MSEEENEKLKGRLKITKSVKGNVEDIHITIDDKRLQEKRESDTEVSTYIRSQLARALQEHGEEVDISSIRSVEDIRRYSQRLKELNSPEPREKPTGTVSLASQSAGSDSEGFESHKEMVDYLKEMSKGRGLESQEARKILDALWREKMPQAVENRKIIAQFPSDEELSRGETMKSLLNKEYRRKRKRREEEFED